MVMALKKQITRTGRGKGATERVQNANRIGRRCCCSNASAQGERSSRQWWTDKGVRISIPEEFDTEEELTEMAEFLAEDLRHLFDEQGIDKRRYASEVTFLDPITRHTTIGGYLGNIEFLRKAFKPDFLLFSVTATGRTQLTTRWRMKMDHLHWAPFATGWKPRLLFSGVSIMDFDEYRMQFTSHIDKWDSLRNSDYFSLEGVFDLIEQVSHPSTTPEIPTVPYDTIWRTRDYEIRSYAAYKVVERPATPEQEKEAFLDLAGYIGGRNASGSQISMTAPVISRPDRMQFALPQSVTDPPEPQSSDISVGEEGACIVAARLFNGRAEQGDLQREEKALRRALKRDGFGHLIAGDAFLARYNEPDVQPFFRRNEVLLPLSCFEL